MGKRSNFPRRPYDAYQTPLQAVLPLIPHLRAQGIHDFVEPCCGDGDLVRHLELFGLRCVYAGDILTGQDLLAIERFDVPVITNSTWTRKLLHPQIEHLRRIAPLAWLLFDADWSHTKQSRHLIQYCSQILPLGRVPWIPDSPSSSGKDNAAWHLFEPGHTSGPILLPYRSEPTRSRVCAAPDCRRTFIPARSTGRFCSPTCRQRAHRDSQHSLSVTLASRRAIAATPRTPAGPSKPQGSIAPVQLRGPDEARRHGRSTQPTPGVSK